MQNDWLSVKIETELESFRFSFTQSINICSALRSSSKKHVRAALYAFNVMIMVGGASYLLVTFTPAPPLSVPPLDVKLRVEFTGAVLLCGCGGFCRAGLDTL